MRIILRLIASLALAVALTGIWAAPAVSAINPEERLADPAMEAQAREISKQLRCVVCDNASIDDSDAQVAQDMRKFIRDGLLRGDSPEAIKADLVTAYDEFVLLMPRFSLTNLPIWLAAPVAVGLGLFWIWRLSGRGGAARAEPVPADTPPPPLSEEERRRLDELLKDDRRSGA